jgi:hypothetical protein
VLIAIKKDMNNNIILKSPFVSSDKLNNHNVENPEANPLIPSIKFNEFINSEIHNIENKILNLPK